MPLLTTNRMLPIVPLSSLWRAMRLGLSRAAVLLLLAATPALGQEELLRYRATFGPLSAGTAELIWRQGEQADSLTVLNTTAGLVDRLFRVRDTLNMVLEPNTGRMLSRKAIINEGRYHKRREAFVDGDSLRILGNAALYHPEPIYDALGLIYALRQREIQAGDTVTVDLFDGKRIRKLLLLVSDSAPVNVPAGTFECLLIRPAPLDGQKLTKVKGELAIWQSKEPPYVAVKVRQTASVGIMEMRLLELP